MQGADASPRRCYGAQKTIKGCEQYVRENYTGAVADCDVYAIKGEIVWKHKFPWHVSEVSTSREPIAPAPKVTGNLSKRSVAYTWEGYSGVLTGTVELRQGARSGTMTATYPETGATCEGRFWVTNAPNGNWVMDCGGGLTAKGRFTGLGHGKGSRGEGTDSLGRKIQFILGAEGSG